MRKTHDTNYAALGCSSKTVFQLSVNNDLFVIYVLVQDGQCILHLSKF